jgi:hypothetical protein
VVRKGVRTAGITASARMVLVSDNVINVCTGWANMGICVLANVLGWTDGTLRQGGIGIGGLEGSTSPLHVGSSTCGSEGNSEHS